jgi:hypothetical protein
LSAIIVLGKKISWTVSYSGRRIAFSFPIPPVVPDENVIFGSHWEKYGK